MTDIVDLCHKIEKFICILCQQRFCNGIRIRGASQKANNLLQRMLHSYENGDSKLKPDLLSYNTVLTAYQKEGDAEAAASLLGQMVKQGDEEAKPDAHSYTAVSLCEAI